MLFKMKFQLEIVKMAETGGEDGVMKKKRVLSEKTRKKNQERSKKWKKDTKTNRKLLEQQVESLQEAKAGLELELEVLANRLKEVSSTLEEVLKERESLATKLAKLEEQVVLTGKIAENCKHLVVDLPPNSPFRRPILAYLVAGLALPTALEFFGISRRTYQRIQEDIGNNLMEVKYTIGVTRTRVSEQQLADIQRILDDILPKQSGRDWRSQECTDKKLYETYVAQVQRGTAVSKSFFIYNVVAGENIHHSKKPKFCPLCEQYEAGDRSPAILRHKQLVPVQRGQYSLEKREIGAGKAATAALVTQDFTQITYDGGFSQDLIICIYTHNPTGKDGLDRYYRHFVGSSTDKNDVSFVVGCWKVVMEEKRLDRMESVKIWSDGGPKHFKISANIRFLLSLQQARPDIEWSYNFFPSYHGCSVCDAAASHIKQQVNRSMRDEQIPIRTPQQVIEVGSQLQHHEVTAATVTETGLQANTLKGIKQYHKFVASAEKNVIYAYGDSVQPDYDHRYFPRNVVSLDDIIV